MAMEMNEFFFGERPEPSWIVNSSRRMVPAYSSDYSSSRMMSQHDRVYNPHSNDTSRHVSIPVVELKVPMCCSKCEEKVREEIFELDGVHRVVCDPITHKVIVTGFVDPLRVLKKAKHVKSKSQFWAAATSLTFNATTVAPRHYGDYISTEKLESRRPYSHDSKFRTTYSQHPSPTQSGTTYGKYPSPSEYGTAYDGQYRSRSEYGTAHDGQYPSPREYGTAYDRQHPSRSEYGTSYDGQYPSPREYGTAHDGRYPSPREYGTAYDGHYPSPREYATAYDGQYPALTLTGRKHGFQDHIPTEIMRHSPYRYDNEFRSDYTQEHPSSRGSYLDSQSYHHHYAPAPHSRSYTSVYDDVITNPYYLQHIESEYY